MYFNLKFNKIGLFETHVVWTNLELLAICFNKNISILVCGVLPTTRIELRHEVVVEVIVAAHSN